MRFQKEVWERYSIARNQAKRTLRRGARNGTVAALPMLEAVLEQVKTVGEVDLGVLNIPVKQIVGLASESEKENYTTDFLPLPSVKSEFAEKWTQMYLEHLTDRGLVEPIRCYEYLGEFYVVDGKKRISVLKVDGTTMVKASVTRILPVETDDPRIQSYYEFVRTFEKTGLYQIMFTRPGKSDAFLKAIGYEPDHVWNDTDRFGFIFNWHAFEYALKAAFDGQLSITTADAVSVLLKDHSYADLKKMHTWTLAELMQDAWVDMFRISDPAFDISTSTTMKAS